MTKRTITLGMSAGIALTGAFLVGPNAGAGTDNGNGYGIGQFEQPNGCTQTSGCVTEVGGGSFAFFGRDTGDTGDGIGAVAIKLDGEDLFIGWASDGVEAECGEPPGPGMGLNGSGRFLGFGVGGSEEGDFFAGFGDADSGPDVVVGQITGSEEFLFAGDVTHGFIKVNCQPQP